MNCEKYRKYRAVVLGLLLFAFQATSFAQEKKLEKSSFKAESEDIEGLIESAVSNSISNPQESFDLIEKSLEHSIKNKDKSLEAKSYNALGIMNYNLEQYDLSISYFNKAIRLKSYINDAELHKNFYDLARSYEKLGNSEESLKFYNIYLRYVEKTRQTNEIITVKQDIARVYTANKNYKQALNSYDEILEIEESSGNKTQSVETNKLIGDVYMQQQMPAQAVDNYSKAVEIADKTNDKTLKRKTRGSLSKAYRENKEYDKELEVRKEVLESSIEESEPEAEAEENLEIGKIYMEQQKPDEAMNYIQRSLEISDQTGNIRTKGAALKSLSKAYKDQGSYDKALIAYQEYAEITDAIYTRRENELKKDLEVVASINRKLQRIDLLERDFAINRQTLELLQKEQDLNSKELSNQRKITLALIIVVLALSTASFFVYKSSLQRRRANQLLALKSLRSQMNPHFIFNSLNSVNSYIAQNNERMANKYLSDFSMLMRSVMENSKNDFVSITSEIDIIDLYLKLEHSRFQDKFEYSFHVEKEIKSSEIQIPPMLIQPYIENSIWHGLRYKKDKGTLLVEMKKDEDSILVLVTDNGIGRKKSAEIKTKHQQKNNSTGLKNTKNRLDIINEIYRTKYSVDISDKDQSEDVGTVVRIRIPFSIKNDE